MRREHRARESRCPARALPATCVSPPTGTLVRLTAPTCSERAGVPRASVTRRVAPCPGARVESLRGHNRGGCGVREPDCFSSTRCTSPPPPDLDLPSDDGQECGITARFMNSRQSRCTQTTTSRRPPPTRDDSYTRARALPLRRRERAWSSPRLGRPWSSAAVARHRPTTCSFPGRKRKRAICTRHERCPDASKGRALCSARPGSRPLVNR